MAGSGLRAGCRPHGPFRSRLHDLQRVAEQGRSGSLGLFGSDADRPRHRHRLVADRPVDRYPDHRLLVGAPDHPPCTSHQPARGSHMIELASFSRLGVVLFEPGQQGPLP